MHATMHLGTFCPRATLVDGSVLVELEPVRKFIDLFYFSVHSVRMLFVEEKVTSELLFYKANSIYYEYTWVKIGLLCMWL